MKQNHIFLITQSFRLLVTTLLFSNTFLHAALEDSFLGQHIIAQSLDELVVKGAEHIKNNGLAFNAAAGPGRQAYNVSYTLINPRNRLHYLRAPLSIKYFCDELLAYFNGSLRVEDGLGKASSFWYSLADEVGCIQSNYGHYIFHQKIEVFDNRTQYEWVIHCLSKNKDSRRALININQINHKKSSSKDFPCTIGMQFFIQNYENKNYLCCVVSSRSTDIYTGLAYDMGFFSFVTELVYKDLEERFPEWELQLGTVTMKSTFTQIYDKSKKSVAKVLTLEQLAILKKIQNNELDLNDQEKIAINPTLSSAAAHAHETMPIIDNAQETLNDIYQGTYNSTVMSWLHEHSSLYKKNDHSKPLNLL